MPTYVKRKTGPELIEKLEKYILFCKSRNYSFSTTEEFLQKSNAYKTQELV